MPVGMEIGLGQGGIVLDGDPARPHGKGHSSPFTFRPQLLWHGHPSQQLLNSCSMVHYRDRPTDHMLFGLWCHHFIWPQRHDDTITGINTGIIRPHIGAHAPRCGLLLKTEQRVLPVCLSVRRSITVLSPKKTVEPIEIPFGLWTWMDSTSIRWGCRSPYWKQQFWGENDVPLQSIVTFCRELCKRAESIKMLDPRKYALDGIQIPHGNMGGARILT